MLRGQITSTDGTVVYGSTGLLGNQAGQIVGRTAVIGKGCISEHDNIRSIVYYHFTVLIGQGEDRIPAVIIGSLSVLENIRLAYPLSPMRNAITQQAYHHKQYQGKKDMKIQKTPDTLRSGMFLFLLFPVIFFIFIIRIPLEIIGNIGFPKICVLHSFIFQVYNLNIRHVIHVFVSFHSISPF